MSEQNETKGGKVDMISSLQMKQSQNEGKKKEAEYSDEDWNDFSDDEETPTEKVGEKSAVVKTEDKSKKYSNLKDYFGDDTHANKNKNKNFHQKGRKQGGTFYKENNREKKEFSRPVFTSSIVKTNNDVLINNNDAYGNIRNNNQEYTKKNTGNYNNNYNNNYGNYNTYGGDRRDDRQERPNFKNTNQNRDRDAYQNRDKDGFKHNKEGNYQNKYHQKTNPNDEKETVMKSIGNFSNLVKNIDEDNKTIKAPLKNYTDIDVTKDKYKKQEDEIQRPTFKNTALENKPSNFRELDHQGDLYLKKIQESHLENVVEYSNKGDKDRKHKDHKDQGEFKEHRNYKKRNNYQKEEDSEEIPQGEFANNDDEELQREDSGNYNNNNYDDGFKYKKYGKKNYGNGGYGTNYRRDHDVWDIVTGSVKNENANEDTSENYSKVENKDFKPKKIIRKEKPGVDADAKKTDKNAKSIKELFG